MNLNLQPDKSPHVNNFFPQTTKNKPKVKKRISTTQNKFWNNNDIITQVPQNMNKIESKYVQRPLMSYTPNSQRSIVFTNNPVQNKLLPAQNPKNAHKKTLVLDLDETWVHSGFTPFERNDIIWEIEFDNNIFKIYVLIRPGAEDFIKEMEKYFEVVIFTASLSKYANPWLNKLDKNNNCSFRLFREHCTFIGGVYIKDLKRWNRDWSKVIIVDNSPIAFSFNTYNGIPISSWYCAPEDNALYEITPILKFLSGVDDVRQYIPRFVINDSINYLVAKRIIKESGKWDELKVGGKETAKEERKNDINSNNNEEIKEWVNNIRKDKNVFRNINANKSNNQNDKHTNNKHAKLDLLVHSPYKQFQSWIPLATPKDFVDSCNNSVNTNSLIVNSKNKKENLNYWTLHTLKITPNTSKNQTPLVIPTQKLIKIQEESEQPNFKKHNLLALKDKKKDKEKSNDLSIHSPWNNNHLQLTKILQINNGFKSSKLRISNSSVNFNIINNRKTNQNTNELNHNTIHWMYRSKSTGKFNDMYQPPQTPRTFKKIKTKINKELFLNKSVFPKSTRNIGNNEQKHEFFKLKNIN